MSEKKFGYVPSKGGLKDIERPWLHYIEPFRMAPHVYSVGGNDDVCVYLLDTGRGLILIDTGMEQSVYLLVDSIHRLGFDPRDIKMILLSHYHGDHVNGARLLHEISGAEIWLSEEDEAMHQLHAADTIPFRTLPYEVNHFYRADEPVVLGRFAIHTRLTPGHTPGATSFFFTDTDDVTGKTYRMAMHGGVGVNQMKPENLAKNGLKEEHAHRFIRDCEEMAEIPVDITLPSHLNQINLWPNISPDKQDYGNYIEPTCWGDLMHSRAEAVKAFYPEIYAK